MKLEIEGIHLNILTAIYDKPINNIILKGKNLKLLPLKSGKDKGVYSLHSYSIETWNV
jgi:hypothetical protein